MDKRDLKLVFRPKRRQNVYRHVKSSLQLRREFLEKRLVAKKRRRRRKSQAS
jgi:hypothetical protein